MKILVTVASKHGATEEIGEIIAGALRAAGHEAETRRPDEVASLDRYQSVVAGSAIYAGRWLEPARDFVGRHAGSLARMPVWLFSSGPIGDPPLPEGEPPEGLALADRLTARGHRTFAGRLDRGGLGFVERTITKALRAPDGDFRRPDAIRSWAEEIAAELAELTELAPQPV